VKVAAVDCGTNSVRLLIRDLPGADLHREMRIVRLGEGVDRTGSLAPQAIERTREALASYRKTCDQFAVERIRMVATSATRDASNRAEFVAMVVETLGVEPEVASGDEEAALSFRGATRGLDPADGPFLVMDIGGGSTELVLGTTEVEAARSVDIGCVRLTERHLTSDPPTAAEVERATADVDLAIHLALEVVPADRVRTAIGLAGSVTTVAALALGLETYEPDRIHLSRVSRADVHRITGDLLSMTREERSRQGVMHPGRVDVIGGGALVLDRAMTLLGLEEIVVSESDILDGIALSLGDS
jgi:exopolyphosphatase/guanosine-5'-triphosphate,3'-diphosphate pyrophosphatase